MILVGCDLHARKQQVAVLDSETGEVQEGELGHQGDEIEQFYAALPRPVTVAVESTGYALWFHALMRKLGHTLLVADAAKIRAMVVRKTKTDRWDALHLLDLLKHDRLPAIWVPDPATRDLRALLPHRMRLVRMRTMVKNGLQSYSPGRGSARKCLLSNDGVTTAWCAGVLRNDQECAGVGHSLGTNHIRTYWMTSSARASSYGGSASRRRARTLSCKGSVRWESTRRSRRATDLGSR